MQTFLLAEFAPKSGKAVCFDDTKVEGGEGGGFASLKGVCTLQPTRNFTLQATNHEQGVKIAASFPIRLCVSDFYVTRQGSLLAICVIFNSQKKLGSLLLFHLWDDASIGKAQARCVGRKWV